MAENEERLVKLDLPADREILRAFHRMYDKEYGFEREKEDEKAFLDYLEKHQDIYHCLVFLREGKPLGYARGYDRLSTSSCDTVFMLDIIYVSPGHRGQGVGKKMIGALVDYARDLGAARIDLLADVGNDVAQNLYKRFGFKGRTRYQLHRFLKDQPDLRRYFEEKVAQEAALEQRTPESNVPVTREFRTDVEEEEEP